MTTARNIMGRLKPAFSTPQQPAGGGKTRRAATLVEILMSIMVMGIGLVSVASLFPISMLRSIQATQLTNASLLNYQCEDYMQAFPERLYEHFNLPLAKYQPNIEFTPDSISWNRSGVTSMAELQQTLPGNYTVVIDPIGYEYFRRLNLPASAARYGADPNGLHGANIQPRFAIDRKTAGFNLVNGFDQAQAYEMFSSRDSWSDLYSSIEVEIVSATEVKLKDVPGADLGVFLTSIATSSPGRIVLRNETGRESFVSPVANVNSGTQSVFLANSIPANGLFDRVQEARLQLLEPRYTAMITVREQLLSFGPDGAPGIAGIDDDNGDGDNNLATGADDILEVGWEETDDVVRYRGANLVVFFRRDYSERSEQAYAVENLVRQTAGVEFQEIRVFWDGSKPDSKPQIKEGNYLFDPVNGFWYQIRNILVEDGDATTALGNKAAWVPASNNRYAAILLDRTAEANAQYVTFPRNVVEVFDFPAF